MAPVVGPLTSNGDNEVYLDEQDEHANKILAFRRLWCLVVREITPSLHLDIPIPIPHPFGSFLSYLVQEIFATIQASKGLIFRGAAVLQVTDRYVHLAGSRGGGGAEGQRHTHESKPTNPTTKYLLVIGTEGKDNINRTEMPLVSK